jgi:hypothetical protein
MIAEMCYAYAAWQVGTLAYDAYRILAAGYAFLRNVSGWSTKLLIDEKKDEKKQEEKERHDRRRQ